MKTPREVRAKCVDLRKASRNSLTSTLSDLPRAPALLARRGSGGARGGGGEVRAGRSVRALCAWLGPGRFLLGLCGVGPGSGMRVGRMWLSLRGRGRGCGYARFAVVSRGVRMGVGAGSGWDVAVFMWERMWVRVF